MKIQISRNGKIRSFPLPKKWILKGLFLKSKLETDQRRTSTLVKECFTCLKEYKKKHGSFSLLELEEKDGDTVKIIV